MADSKASASIGFGGALFLLFLGLRLTDHIDWAWYWVAAPLWAPLAIVAAVASVFGVVMLIAHALDRRDMRRRKAQRAKGK